MGHSLRRRHRARHIGTTRRSTPFTSARMLGSMHRDLKDANTRADSPCAASSRATLGIAAGPWLAPANGSPRAITALKAPAHSPDTIDCGGGAWLAARAFACAQRRHRHDPALGLGQSEASFEAIPSSTPKLLYVMAREGHFSWGTPTTNGGASGRYVMAWEKVFLEGDTRYRRFLLEKGPQSATWESNVR